MSWLDGYYDWGFRCVENTTVETVSDNLPSISNTSLLEQLPPQEWPKDSMIMINIPAGEFWMGDKNPQKINLDSFWIDETEVTNAMYQKCEQDGKCEKPQKLSTWYADPFYGNQTYANYAIVNVDETQAEAYCDWAGKYLPSEEQWEKAARGNDNRQYPWGNNHPTISGGESDYKVEPEDISPYGVLRMVSGVTEWTISIFPKFDVGGANHFVYNSDINIIRGSKDGGNITPVYFRTGEPQSTYSEWLGFRCATDSVP